MLNNFFETFMSTKYPLIGLFITYTILSFYWIRIFKFFKLETYNNIQRVHQSEVPRVGGLFIYIFLWFIWFFFFVENKFIFNVLVSSIPFFIISIKEDIFHNTEPNSRLFFMTISCFIFFYINPIDFPIVNIPIIGEFISFKTINLLFFTFSILVLMNGMNLIDGMNGLFSFTPLIQLLTLLYLSFIYEDNEILNLTIIFILPLIVFVIFNFPIGKIFVGDFGAYFYGFLNSILTIYFFGKHSDLLSWLAILILFYPCMELLFSFTRKIIQNKSPLEPDNQHLHTLINKKLKKHLNINFANSCTTLILSIFWLAPLFFILNCRVNLINVLICIVITSILYILIYLVLLSIDKRN